MHVGLKPVLLAVLFLGVTQSEADLTGAAVRTNPSSVYGGYDFTLTTMDGKKVKLSDYQGRVVLVNFWATWCGPCLQETPALVRLYNQYRTRGFVVIGVAHGSEEGAVQEFLNQFHVPYPVGRDSTSVIGSAYGVLAIPTSFLFAPDGSVQRKIEGGYGERTDEVLGHDVQALLALAPAPQEPQKPEPALAEQSKEELRETEKSVAPKPPPAPQPTPPTETEPPAPAPVLADHPKEEPRPPESYAALQPRPAPQEAAQPGTGASKEPQSETALTYRRWNFAVPVIAMVGLLLLARVRLRVGPVEAAGAVSPAPVEPPPSVPYARLLLRSSLASLPTEIPFLHDDILIGSGADCDVILRHPSIARRHVRVQWKKQGYVLHDLQSPTGTYLNGRRISENLLKDGWVIRLGAVEFVFSERLV